MHSSKSVIACKPFPVSLHVNAKLFMLVSVAGLFTPYWAMTDDVGNVEFQILVGSGVECKWYDNGGSIGQKLCVPELAAC